MQHAQIQLAISSVCVTVDTTVMVVAVRVRLFRLFIILDFVTEFRIAYFRKQFDIPDNDR